MLNVSIEATPLLDNVSDPRPFLGTCGYVSKFILNYAKLTQSNH